ncbi:MAG: arylesterase [Gemmatimonadales bacterium]
MTRKILTTGWTAVLCACAPQGDRQSPARTGGAPAVEASATDTTPAVVFLGTSLTAGLGLDPAEAYPALIQRKLDSAGIRLRVVNAGLSGETAAGGLRRLDRLLDLPVRVVVIELGANDALRGQDLGATRRTLQEIITRARARRPDAHLVLAGMEAPPNLGAAYTREFRELFRGLARANGVSLIPVLLEGVAGVPELNQEDGIHPTAEGHRRMADNVWQVLQPIVRPR